MSNPWSESFEDMRSSVEKLHEANQQRFKFRVKDKNKGTYTVKTTRQRADILRRTPSVLSVERIEMSENVEEIQTEAEVRRWWDDDGDGRGYEPGEVSGKFKKKKKKSVRKEGYSDWRSEMPENFFFESLTEKVSPASPYCDVMPDQKSGEDQKDPQRGTQNQKLLKMRKEDLDLLAEELGGEVVDIQEYAAAVSAVRALPAISRILKTGGLKGFRVPVKPPHLPRAPKLPTPKTTPTPAPAPLPVEPAPKPVPQPKPEKPTKPEKPGKPTKPEKPGKPTKPERKPEKPVKPEPKKKPTEKGGVVVPAPKEGSKPSKTPEPTATPSPKETPKTAPVIPGGGGGKSPGGSRRGIPKICNPDSWKPGPDGKQTLKQKAIQALCRPKMKESPREIGIVKARAIEK